MHVVNPSGSSPSAFHRNVAGSRSSAPTRCSASVPARGGSHGVSVLGPPHWMLGQAREYRADVRV